jgi:hypothetical protein
MDQTGQEYKAELLVRPDIQVKISTRSVHAALAIGCCSQASMIKSGRQAAGVP